MRVPGEHPAPRPHRLVLAALVCAVMPACSGGILRVDPPAAPENYLPVGAPARELVGHARRMPAVKLAMAEFDARGYIRRADVDTAATSDSASMAVICYEKPGVDPTLEQPFVVVASRIGADGILETRVLGGVLAWDTETRQLEAVENGSDRGVAVKIGSMSETAIRNYRLERTAGFSEWAKCAAVGCFHCLVHCYAGGIMVGPCTAACCFIVGIACIFA